MHAHRILRWGTFWLWVALSKDGDLLPRTMTPSVSTHTDTGHCLYVLVTSNIWPFHSPWTCFLVFHLQPFPLDCTYPLENASVCSNHNVPEVSCSTQTWFKGWKRAHFPVASRHTCLRASPMRNLIIGWTFPFSGPCFCNFGTTVLP